VLPGLQIALGAFSDFLKGWAAEPRLGMTLNVSIDRLFWSDDAKGPKKLEG